MMDDFGGKSAHGRGAPADGAWTTPQDRSDSGPGIVERIAGALGAVTSLALVAGLGLWTYDLATRDLTEVPVVRALEGPVRVAPDEPGGQVARHQGLTVNAIQADGAETTAPERVVLAPRTQTLSEDDMAPAAELASRSGRSLGIGPSTGAQVMLASADTVAREPWGRSDTDVTPTGDPLRAALAEALQMPEPEAMPAAAVSGVDRSPRPAGRPEIRPTAAEIPASGLPAGTQLVQVGDFSSAEEARAEWEGLSRRFAPYLAGKAPVVQAARSGDRAFWRLRAAGFSDGADARRLCAALSAGGVGCIPVLVR